MRLPCEITPYKVYLALLGNIFIESTLHTEIGFPRMAGSPADFAALAVIVFGGLCNMLHF